MRFIKIIAGRYRNGIYGVMIPFKPREVSFQFFFILSFFGFLYSRNLEKCICCNLSICGLEFVLDRAEGCENGRNKKKIGKIKFMNIDYSRLGHRSRGLAAASERKES